jgi:hypothetical protein
VIPIISRRSRSRLDIPRTDRPAFGQLPLDKRLPICHRFHDDHGGGQDGYSVALAWRVPPSRRDLQPDRLELSSAWTRSPPGGSKRSLVVFTGLILAVAAMVYLVATMRSIGVLGAIIIAAIFGAGLWVLTDWGLLGLDNSSLNTWLGILVLSLILGIGMSWSILRQRLSGQQTTDEVDG